MNPEKKNNAEDQSPVLKEEAIALAEPAPPVVDVAQKRRNTNIGVGIGVLLQVGGLFGQFGRVDVNEESIFIGLLLIVLSIPPFIWGCMNYAESKGYYKRVGLVGLLGIIGLIVLILLPDIVYERQYARMPMRNKVGLVCLVLGCALIGCAFMVPSWVVISRNLQILGICLIIGSPVMLLFRRKKPASEKAKDGKI
ncbi:MAG: hypothetical protein VCB81_00520 [Verrucomicrobiia bacterium]|jgi:hypothetical protein